MRTNTSPTRTLLSSLVPSTAEFTSRSSSAGPPRALRSSFRTCWQSMSQPSSSPCSTPSRKSSWACRGLPPVSSRWKRVPESTWEAKTRTARKSARTRQRNGLTPKGTAAKTTRSSTSARRTVSRALAGNLRGAKSRTLRWKAVMRSRRAASAAGVLRTTCCRSLLWKTTRMTRMRVKLRSTKSTMRGAAARVLSSPLVCRASSPFAEASLCSLSLWRRRLAGSLSCIAGLALQHPHLHGQLLSCGIATGPSSIRAQ
mmetsp:Transcript_40511/g.101781  ORF Transcript_40511/g.101781 Transcript_40511/m.101781 type:complete len:257 (+) Transcript_40511:843-1613(+)